MAGNGTIFHFRRSFADGDGIDDPALASERIGSPNLELCLLNQMASRQLLAWERTYNTVRPHQALPMLPRWSSSSATTNPKLKSKSVNRTYFKTGYNALND